LRLIEFALEDRALDPLSSIDANLRDVAESFSPGWGFRIHIVCDDDQHDSPHEERRISVDFVAKGLGKKLGLDIGNQPDWDFFLKKWVDNDFLLSLLPGVDENGARFVLQSHGAVFQQNEIVGGDLTPVDQGDGSPVGKIRPQFLHDVECKAGPSWSNRMKEADIRV
jgi:hypothetical protein